VTTTQQWSEILFYTQEAISPSTIYIFIVVILIGTGALMNLMIAGMCKAFFGVAVLSKRYLGT